MTDPLGPLVLVIRTDHHGRVSSEWMPAALAVLAVSVHDILTGTYWARARIDAGEVDLRQWDMSL